MGANQPGQAFSGVLTEANKEVPSMSYDREKDWKTYQQRQRGDAATKSYAFKGIDAERTVTTPTAATATPGVAPGAPQDKSGTTSGVAPGFVPPTIQTGGLRFGASEKPSDLNASAAPGPVFASLANQKGAAPQAEAVRPTQPNRQIRPRNPFNIGQSGVPFGG